LFAVAQQILSSHAGIAIASSEAFSRVQSKIAFANLVNELKLPQPKWDILDSPINLSKWKTTFLS
jgi:hypothetical protein